MSERIKIKATKHPFPNQIAAQKLDRKYMCYYDYHFVYL